MSTFGGGSAFRIARSSFRQHRCLFVVGPFTRRNHSPPGVWTVVERSHANHSVRKHQLVVNILPQRGLDLLPMIRLSLGTALLVAELGEQVNNHLEGE
jgi:hypothetical protein